MSVSDSTEKTQITFSLVGGWLGSASLKRQQGERLSKEKKWLYSGMNDKRFLNKYLHGVMSGISRGVKEGKDF